MNDDVPVLLVRDSILIPSRYAAELATALESHRETLDDDAGREFDDRWLEFFLEVDLIVAADAVVLEDHVETSTGVTKSSMKYGTGGGDAKRLTVDELAEEAALSTTYLNRLCRSGQLKAVKVANRWMIDPVAAQNLIDKERHARHSRTGCSH